jgi:hypothetical protein
MGPELFLWFSTIERYWPGVHMPHINSAYSPMVGYAQILKN